jgi:hypothetical protein
MTVVLIRCVTFPLLVLAYTCIISGMILGFCLTSLEDQFRR